MQSKIYVVNALNEREPLSETKLINSARRSGADFVLAKEISKDIMMRAHDGITTKEIYGLIKKELLKKAPQVGMKYSLKESIRKLGPTGF